MTDAPAAPPPSPPLSPLRAMASRMYGRPAIVPDAQSAMGGPKPASPAVPPKTEPPAESEKPAASSREEVAARLYANDTPEAQAEAAKAAETEKVQSGFGTFKLPEGFALDTETAKTVTPLLKGLKADQRQAQAIVDAGVTLVRKNQQALLAEHQSEISGWRKAAQTEFGAELPATVEAAKFAINTALPAPKQRAELHALLNASGLGNHPAMIRLLAAAGRAMRGR